VSSRTARATQRNPVSKKQTHRKKKKKNGGVGWGFGSIVEHLPSKRKALGSVSALEKTNKQTNKQTNIKKKKKKRK
jgi:hypothetical protein